MKLSLKLQFLRLVVMAGLLATSIPGMVEAKPADAAISSKSERLAPFRKRVAALKNKVLIEKGRRLFMEETFDGNGRTCATCHPPTNNFTIDPSFIAGLPANDPLFVAEFNPKLTELEDSVLLRRFGLILENLDGFDQPGVLRGVPHTLALPTSIKGNASEMTRADGSTRANALGWSGDGGGGNGSMRDFAIGAITQHFPKTMARIPGKDFRLPTPRELDALEAFQLSLGRQADPDLNGMTFAESGDSDINQGKALFNGEVPSTKDACSRCHNDAGATDHGENRNFNTGVALLQDTEPRKFDPSMTGDGGFDIAPVQTLPMGVANLDFRGTHAFNVPPLIEAADTPPFFHSNAFNTLEEVIRFYTDANRFKSDRDVFVLSEQQIEEIADFLRAMNALENLRSCAALAQQAQRQPKKLAKATLEMAMADTEDAIDVLNQGSIYADAIDPLSDALEMLEDARETARRPFRNSLLGTAIELCNEARDIILQ